MFYLSKEYQGVGLLHGWRKKKSCTYAKFEIKNALGLILTVYEAVKKNSCKNYNRIKHQTIAVAKKNIRPICMNVCYRKK